MSEQELIIQLKNPNTRNLAFNQLVRLEQKRIYGIIRRMVISHEDADDITQIVFIRVFEKIDTFKGDSSLSTWIYRIAVNETLGFLRHKRHKMFIPIINVERQLENTLESDAYFDGDKMELKLQKAILALPEKQRLVFNMRYYEELKYEEISQILGTSVGALKASYHIAEKKIEEILNRD